MKLRLYFCKSVALMLSVALHAQTTPVASDDKAVTAPIKRSAAELLLERAEKALAVSSVRAVQYIAQGRAGAVGQSFEAGRPWPQLKYPGYALLANYEHSSLREEIVRERTTTLGGPPGLGEQRLVHFYREQSAWNMLGPIPVPVPSAVPERTVMLWATPHGALIAARRNISQLQLQGGKNLVFTQPQAFQATVVLNAKFQVQEVRMLLPHPVLGDTVVVNTYADYQTFGNIPFPTRIRQTWGGYPSLDLTVQQVQTNPTFVINIPDRALNAPERVSVEPLAEGVWLLAGGLHNSVAIEMHDHIVLVDSPVNDARTQAIVGELAKRIPDKKITQVINTHAHFDTLGGIRGVLAQGATVMAAENSRALMGQVWAGSHRILPDSLAKQPDAKPQFIAVTDRYQLTDSVRNIEIYALQGSMHAKGMLAVYLPKEKILIQSDAYTPGPPFSAPPKTPQPAHLNLLANIERLRLDVERIVALRGRTVNVDEFYKAVGKK